MISLLIIVEIGLYSLFNEDILRDAIWTGKEYADDILMTILEDEWKLFKNTDK